MDKKNTAIIVIFCFFIFVGYLFFSLFFTEQQKQKQVEFSKAQSGELVSVIKGLEVDITQLEDSIEDTRKQMDALRKEQTEGAGLLHSVERYLENSRTNAGLSELTGSGMSITINDNNTQADIDRETLGPYYDPSQYIIHDKNILYLINDIKNAKPEGIAVNDQRIVTTTNIRCVGTVILINDKRLAPPYVIDVVGDPMKISTALLNSNEYQLLMNSGFPIAYKLSANLTISGYKGTFLPNYTTKYVEPDTEKKAEDKSAGGEKQ